MTYQDFTELPHGRSTVLANRTCIYCGVALDKQNRQKEHVVGRNFTPGGALLRQWSLIAQACAGCNLRKSDLEDDISAITLHPQSFINLDDANAVLNEARRKARGSKSRWTKKPVIDSSETTMVKGSFGPSLSISAELVGPPHIEPARVYDLARFHVTAFFYFLTFKKELGVGMFWGGTFLPVIESLSSDWGNPVQLAFMKEVAVWEPLFVAPTANGFFKIAIRQHPDGSCWAWALEWNKSRRIIGFCGDHEASQSIAACLPTLQYRTISESQTERSRYRNEMPLPPEHDTLFHWPVA